MADAWQSAWVEVLPDFKNFRSNANRELTSILGDAGDSGGRSGSERFGGSFMGGIGKLALPIAGAFAALGIGQMIGDAVSAGLDYAGKAIDLASNLSETRSAVQAVFGGAAGDIEEFAATASEKLGQTEQQALSAAQTFGLFGQAAGLSGSDLSGFTTDLATLATDLASFHNTSVNEAIDAIGAGLRGEAEPLRRFNVLLDDATLKAEAMKLGIYEGTGSLTAQQRVLAANAAIFAQSNVAQGDFAKTSGGLAGQQKLLAAAFAEAQTNLGSALLPAMTSLMTIANTQLVPILNDVINKVGPTLGAALTQSAPAFGEMITQLAPLLPQLAQLGAELLPVVIETVKLLSPMLLDWAANTSYLFSIVNGFFSFLNGDATLGELAGVMNTAKGSAADLARGFLSAAQSVTGSIFGLQSSIGQFAGQMFANGRNFVQGFVNGVASMARALVARVRNVFSNAVEAAKNLLGIHSPSTVAMGMGVNFGEGWQIGLNKSAKKITTPDGLIPSIPGINSMSARATASAFTAQPAGGSGITWNGNIVTSQPADRAFVSKVRQQQFLLGMG